MAAVRRHWIYRIAASLCSAELLFDNRKELKSAFCFDKTRERETSFLSEKSEKMVEKKRYIKPAVESEEAMQQTSLACTSTWSPLTEEVCDPGTNLVRPANCETLPWKGGNFIPGDIPGCSVLPYSDECIIGLS